MVCIAPLKVSKISMIYALIVVILFALMLVYFKIADRYNIIDKPNNRSSHTVLTIRGGGVIFPIALLLYAAFFHQISLLLIAGILVVGIISFLDDMHELPRRVRIFGHLAAVTALIYSMPGIIWPFWALPILYIVIIGAINAYNFMDGINGITGLYTLVILVSLWYTNTLTFFTDPSFIIIFILACLVFLFFNFRKKAKCFAGDVGSVSIGFWIIALLIMLIIKSGDLKYILFLAVYGVDAILTIVHRLLLKQNIFDAHRLHFYQILANDCKMPHLLVSAIYGIIQLIVNGVVIYTDLNIFLTALIVLLPLILIYVLFKRPLMVVDA
jgi:UDP-N-acetylmuramyl pentapeptide phosphotransferase/UDP-N-acetylglucosamine-1-phosphate transferase